jgi:FtsP/CotA-like multicopper oxidase with cupredoxin domain
VAYTRRTLLTGTAAALAAPGWIGRAWAADAGAPLPIPNVLELGSSGAGVLEAIEGQHAFGGGLRASTWGFNQAFLGPLLRVRRGSTARVDVHNRLREDITVHWHGLHVPGRVDGGPHSPIAPGARWSPALEIEQSAATLWYHSHVHGRTGPQVYRGLAGLLIVDDPQASAADLPSHYGVDDLPLVIQDRAFGRDGRLVYANRGPALMAGFRGDRIIVNGALRPSAAVPAAVVRLRLLNGCNARTLHLRFEDGRALHVIGSDGGLLARPLAQQRLTLASGERAEVLVDFGAGYGTRLLCEPDTNSPMGGMMGGRGMSGMGVGAEPEAVADGGAFEVMRFVVDGSRSAAQRAVPERTAAAAKAPALGEPVRRRRFVLDTHGGMMGGAGMGMRGGMGGGMGMMAMTINGRAFDMQRIDAQVRCGETELWEVRASDMAHPFHVHGTSFQVVSRNGTAVDFAASGWKDTVLVDGVAEILVRFDHRADDRTPYMFHCHILEHEDAGMMGQFTVA